MARESTLASRAGIRRSTCARPRQLAERVLLPGDPGRALLLAQALLERAADVQPPPRAVGLHGHGAATASR